MPNGEIWKNVVIEEKAKPAETLAEFRANYKYNLLDKNLLAFNAEVPIFSQWDDHEVTKQLVAGRAADPRRAPAQEIRREERIDPGGARQPRGSMNTCRCASPRPSPDASIARFRTDRCSTCSCSTCAAIAGPTAKAKRRAMGRRPISSGPRKWPGSSANS